MAWHFDEVNDYVTLADNAALTFPDGDWTVAGWIEPDDNVGSFFQYFLSWGVASVTPSFNLFIYEASEGTFPNDMAHWLVDDDGTNHFAQNTATLNNDVFASPSGWYHILMRRTATNFEVYINNTLSINTTPTSFNAINRSDALYFGGRSDLNADRFFGGNMAEWAKWDRALTTQEISDLANGLIPSEVLSPVWWVRMLSGDYSEEISSITVTNNGTVGATHPPIFVTKAVSGLSSNSGLLTAEVLSTILQALSGVSSNSGILSSLVNRVKSLQGVSSNSGFLTALLPKIKPFLNIKRTITLVDFFND